MEHFVPSDENSDLGQTLGDTREFLDQNNCQQKGHNKSGHQIDNQVRTPAIKKWEKINKTYMGSVDDGGRSTGWGIFLLRLPFIHYKK